jgi:enoyl-CoA hydratase/carnithine racemase
MGLVDRRVGPAAVPFRSTVAAERSFEAVQIEENGSLCWLALDRSVKCDAPNFSVLDEIDAVLADVAASHTIRLLTLRGSGHGFRAGHRTGPH